LNNREVFGSWRVQKDNQALQCDTARCRNALVRRVTVREGVIEGFIVDCFCCDWFLKSRDFIIDLSIPETMLFQVQITSIGYI
jgi:hypothetical protein